MEKIEKIVYILGAGASRDLEFPITTADLGYGTVKTDKLQPPGPLSAGYFYDIDRLLTELEDRIKPFPFSRPIISDNLKEYAIKFYEEINGCKIKTDDLFKNEAISRKLNIEDFYIFLEEENKEKLNSKKSEDMTPEEFVEYMMPSFIKISLKEYIHESLSMMCNYCFSLHHIKFAEFICKENCSVISFNWDILFEQAMAATQKWCFENGYGIDFTDVHYKYKKDKPSDSFPESKVLILKPHGSINWYKKTLDNGRYVYEDRNIFLIVPINWKLRGGTFNEHLHHSEKINGCLLKSFIVPPGMKRDMLGEVRKKMCQNLSEADTIISIGFSFNNKDDHIVEEFKDIEFKNSLKVLVINPNNEIVDKHKEAFRTENVVKVYNTFAEFCGNDFKT